jgi:hypothetical protein
MLFDFVVLTFLLFSTDVAHCAPLSIKNIYTQNPSVLWRIMNGEMPTGFNPKIWWLQLGLNDIGQMQCSEEVVVLGILRIVEEILYKKPNAKIIINSLLPMPSLRRDARQEEYLKSLRNKPKGGRGPKNSAAPPRDGKRIGALGGHRQLRWFAKNRDEDQDQKGTTKMYDNKHHQKKYGGIAHKERKLPLWTSITSINEQLKKFCAKHDGVSFFDATEFFAEQDGDFWVLKKDMITVRGHPTEAGYAAWEAGIAKRASKMLRVSDP